MTPSLALVRIHTSRGGNLRLWLPLFLLWIPFLLLLPLILLALMVASFAGRMNPWRVTNSLGAVLCSLLGTDMRVVSAGSRVTVSIL
jgi:uncharacterized SAM-binding protein YcdF (DUF218 family)